MRYLSNRSSGKMGYAIAEAALEAGHEVTLISGPVASAAAVRRGASCRVTTERGNVDAVRAAVRAIAMSLVMCAAVADYKPAQFSRAENEEERDRRFRSSSCRPATFSPA